MRTEAALDLPASRWVDVSGPVHYREWSGPAHGPVFVLVHGLGGSLLNWAGVAPGLARRGRVLALDLAGFGLTPPEGRASGVGANRRLLDGFVRSLDLPPAVLVGNSMGGMISMIQAAHAPATVHSLILVDAAFPRGRSVRAQPSPWIAAAFGVYTSQRVGERVMSARARRLVSEGLVRSTLKLCCADPESVDPAIVDALVELVRTRESFDYAVGAFAQAARSIFLAQARPARYREVVRAVRAPALVIHGDRDRLVPLAAAREAAAEHPNWDLRVFDGIGHLPTLEAPGRFLTTVEEWLDRPPDGRGGPGTP